ncbi:KUP/HAK/KT family potassium transporter [Lactovum miscens]|uniref:Probable potassium transport system protein Kup n=1 Tax=Lactovum miscens TaxID=190387 RepID=A0A841C502_9LACT|nr:KUP system potassium uptake protein [Lactovum miscens]
MKIKKKVAEVGKWPKASLGGFLIALGVVYGDIGTSPLYAMKSIVTGQGGGKYITENFVIGSVSMIFWTLTLLTTIKYVLIALNADNHKEGGIFSLYTLVRRFKKWLIIPAMIGGAALLSDGTLTPAVTVTSAIEGLRGVPGFVNTFGSSQNVIVVITLSILALLFLIQRFGTDIIGRLFGPIMMIWFLFIGGSGFLNMLSHVAIWKALNPWYAIELLFNPVNHAGIFILGSVFLATTGAEALYSDLGHVGKPNIHTSWPVVKICLFLNYAGQGAFLLRAGSNYGSSNNFNPFFDMLPSSIRVYAVILATLAAIIASQALITGSFTLVSEAIRLKMLPLLKILYPGKTFGQMYIPAVNLALWFVTSLTVLYFQSSDHMEAAYGLAITITMLMTTLLLSYYLVTTGMNPVLARLTMSFFALVEIIFFVSSAVKFMHGGYVVVIIAVLIMFVMFVWIKGNAIVNQYVKKLDLKNYVNQLNALRHDKEVDFYQTNVVYLTSRMKGSKIDMSILYSILDKKPKRAETYWFVNVKVTDTPYNNEYEVDMMGTDFIVRVTLYLGFRMPQEVPRYLRAIVQDLMASGRLPKQHQAYSIKPGRDVGDFGFIVIEEHLNNARTMSAFDRFILQTKISIKKFTTSPARWFGLQFSEYNIERVPLILSDVKGIKANERNHLLESAPTEKIS